MEERLIISGNIVDVLSLRIYPGTLYIKDGKIEDVEEDQKNYDRFIVPGFVDSHIHIESSMLTPSEFSRAVSVHGTVATLSDPHEIANVLGTDGVLYMIEDMEDIPFRIYFGAPSCVPATPLETSGAELGPKEVEDLLKRDDIVYLSEVMNFPGVISEAPEVIEKIQIARRYGKKIDGHAPGLRGKDLKKYISFGIDTDHECLDVDEAEEKLSLGMKIMIREGSASKGLNRFMELIDRYPDMCMLCSDDLHPDDLQKGHINILVSKCISEGIDLFKVLRCVTLNPIRHYGLDVGCLRKGDWADLIIIDDLKEFHIRETYIKGRLCAKDGKSEIPVKKKRIINRFNIDGVSIENLRINARGERVNVIGAKDQSLITERLIEKVKIKDGYCISDPERDILKICVVNRYRKAPLSIGFIKGFGLKRGAIASSVSHDSHNIICVGVRDEDMCKALNLIIKSKGGICAIDGDSYEHLPLSIAGIMSDMEIEEVSRRYKRCKDMAKKLGSSLKEPFMTLSFMALLVIPELKIGDRGLFLNSGTISQIKLFF